MYTTKAAGTDKKLYREIDKELETQHESRLKLSNSLPKSQKAGAAISLNLARATPFGSFANTAARKAFAYLIATLNAVHPDYDFSHVLRPDDFKREKSLKHVINTLNNMLMNLRPKPFTSHLAANGRWALKASAGAPTPTELLQQWGPHMWPKIDKEMDLLSCQIFSYQPKEDPYDGDEPALWRMSYFFFNKEKKRVCYFYLKGFSVLSRSQQRMGGMSYSRRRSHGSSKRADYWLGDREGEVFGGWGEDDDDDVVMADWSSQDLETEDEDGDDGEDEDEDGEKDEDGMEVDDLEFVRQSVSKPAAAVSTAKQQQPPVNAKRRRAVSDDGDDDDDDDGEEAAGTLEP